MSKTKLLTDQSSTGAGKLRLSIKGRTCAFGPNSYLVKREEYCVKEGKLLVGKDLRKVKKILKFSILSFGYLRVWELVDLIGMDFA